MRTSGIRCAAWCLALVVLTVVTRLPLLQLNQPIDDEVVYGVAAQTILDGGVPYINAVERKPPLLFYVYAAVLTAFGSDNWRALHAVEVVWILATMAALVVIGRTLFDTHTGLIAAMLYGIFQSWSYWNNLAFNGEVLMNLPLAWAFAIALSGGTSRRLISLFMAGGLIAVAFLLKQPAAIAIVPLALFILGPLAVTRKGYARVFAELALLVFGFSVVLVTMTAWLFTRGLLGEAFYWTITNHAVPEIFWGRAIRNTLAFVAFCAPITIGAWLSVRDPEIWNGRQAERTTFAALLTVSVIGAASSGRFYPHYYIAAVLPCALLAAPWLTRLWRSGGRERHLSQVTQAWLAATVLIFFAAHVRGLSRQPTVSDAGRYLAMHSTQDDRIFVWGQATRIYVDAHRRPASRYIATFPLTGLIFGAPKAAPGEKKPDTHARIVPGAWSHLRADFAQHQPKYIVDTEAAPEASYPVSDFPALLELLANEYEVVAQTSEGVIYRWDRQKALTAAYTSGIERLD